MLFRSLASGAVVALGIFLDLIPTHLPAVFLLFFFASALNVMLLLAKRALAALDRNLLWESFDIVRRVVTLGVLIAVLAGVPLLASVTIQLLLNIFAALLGMALIHRWARMHLHHWFAVRVGGGHVRRSYVGDIEIGRAHV